jgi:hypothetical protein
MPHRITVVEDFALLALGLLSAGRVDLLSRRGYRSGAAPPLARGQSGYGQGHNRYRFGDGFHWDSADVRRSLGAGGEIDTIDDFPISRSTSASALL